MSTFAPGTGGTLTATNLPAAIFELSRLLMQRINAVSSAARPTFISTFTTNGVTGVHTVQFDGPLSVAIQTDGAPKLTATDFLSSLSASGGDNTFAPGTGGTLKSSGLVQAFLEACQLLQNAELAIPAETRPNNVSVTYTTEDGLVSIALTLPVTLTNLVYVATDYL